MSINLSDERYLAALHRMCDRVEKVELVAYDDTTPGNKSLHCSWGLCSNDKDAWPDPEDHLWPSQFVEKGRVAPKYTKTHQRCPIDHRAMNDKSLNGCFYSCRIFQSKPQDRPTKEQVVKLYDERIAEALRRLMRHLKGV